MAYHVIVPSQEQRIAAGNHYESEEDAFVTASTLRRQFLVSGLAHWTTILATLQQTALNSVHNVI